MLVGLYIKNIALIDELEVGFAPGLNVLTGETGAGKSIIIDAVNLVLGGRADRELVRSGCDKAIVEAVFEISSNKAAIDVIEELGFEAEDGVVMLSRELFATGRSVCRISGRMATAGLVKQISETLIDVHGQHEHQSLLNPSRHLAFLDAFAGEEAEKAIERTRQAYVEHEAVIKRLKSDFGTEAERERLMDMLKWQVDEISAARLFKGEEQELVSQLKLLRNGEAIISALTSAYDDLYASDASSMSLLRASAASMEGIASFSEEYEEIVKKLDESFYILEDAAAGLRTMKSSFDYDPALLEEAETRLDVISKLKRKYGGSEEAVLEFFEEVKARLDELENSAETLKKLTKERERLKVDLFEASRDLSLIRRKVAKTLSGKVVEQLKDLGISKAKFEVRFEDMPDAKTAQYTANGFDTAEFMLSANAGEPVRPLAKVASGGEMSRIMLALKNIGAAMNATPVMVFDEIDAGISGKIAHAVSYKMIEISRARQVICVTHLPQIACAADVHYLIEKNDEKGVVKTRLYSLDENGRISEIARLTSGAEISETGKTHAKELLNKANAYKSSIL
ncbi:MAG: DNA repair protein RecN [Christensenellales bacterium]|jgi:DNA repair protein RecN (Recombination protein N)